MKTIVRYTWLRSFILNPTIGTANKLTWFVVTALLVMLQPAHAVSSFGTNLIVNPDAELDSGSSSGDVVASVPGWTTTGNFTVVQYGASGGFPTLLDPGSSDRGHNFFAGGPANSFSSASQQLDVTFASAAINGAGALFSLSGWLGGWSTHPDHAILQVHFLNSVDADLGTASIGPVSNTDRVNSTEFLFRETNGAVPIGTEAIKFELNMTRFAGSYNDGYADNLSFVLTPVPEPETYAMLLAGLGLVGFMARRRKASFIK